MSPHSAFARGLSALLIAILSMPAGQMAFAAARAGADAPLPGDAPAEPAPDPEAPDTAAAGEPVMSSEPAMPTADPAGAEDGRPAGGSPLDLHAVDINLPSRDGSDGLAVDPGPVALAPSTTGSKSAATAQAIPLPKAEGSVIGMGESFAPELGTGAATYSVPFQVSPGRAGVQPSLGLNYSSASGNGPVGMGWSFGAPFIARQSDRGMPRYVDGAAWTPEEDRFFYNGGQELVPVDANAIAIAECGSLDCAPIPAELVGWQQYRARVEGSFMRFFRAPDGRRWVVHGKDGTRHDFGALPSGDGPPEAVTRSVTALQTEHASGQGRVYRWMVTRAADPHGSAIYYLHSENAGQRYLSEIYYTSPDAACGSQTSATARTRCQAPLADYGRRIRLVYEARPDVTTSFTSGWAIQTAQRLRRVEMTSAEGAPGSRTLVRRYHLTYDPSSYWSLLATVQLEGRPQHTDPMTLAKVGDAGVAEGSLGDSIIGTVLPPVRLHYSRQPSSFSFAPGFGGVASAVHHAPVSPPYSVGANADLFDVNSDGLPDLVVTDPAQFHTPSGEPAVGVFFNGFDGAETSPAGAGTFSGAIPAPMRSDLNQILRLSNLNISPMDVDGDGRADYLHLPRQRDYGYFTPVRSGGAQAVTAVTPAQQGWEWAYLDRHLPQGDADPRIDFAHDTARLRQFDVNHDNLVDIVRTTGTSIQVWLNLGWLPGGDGRYGSYSYNAATRQFSLSTAPVESCLPVAGNPLDFGDPEVRLGDMNGDGITDIVRMRAGRVIYWPGRGEGAFGVGAAACGPGLVQGRYVEMTQPPAELNPDLADVYLADMNADGVEDVVQVRFNNVDVWFNYAGHRFSSRVRMQGTPYAPSYDTRVRLVDVDGSGTIDILYARADDWQWVDPMGGQRPRLLSAVENGLGALTELQYESSAEDYLNDLAAADACTGSSCEAFTWSGAQAGCDAKVFASTEGCVRRSGGSPVVSTVVRQVDTTDRLNVIGAAATRLTTRFRYHDGYYEGIEQEFRGFGAADSISVGDENSPTGIQRTYFHQGRRAAEIASDRLADNPEEAIKGAVYLTEAFDEQGTHLATTHTGYTIRRQVIGLSGVAVSYAFASRTDSFLYDTGAFAPSPLEVSLPAIMGWNGTTSVHPRIRVRGERYAQTRSTVDAVDGLDQVQQSTAHGRVRGEFGEMLDERIITHATFVNVAGSATGWMWRTDTTYVEGAGDATRLGDSTITYSPEGDDTRTSTIATQTVVPRFDGDAEAEGFGARAPENIVASVQPNPWGSPLLTCVGGDAATVTGCLRLGVIEYDGDYALTPVRQSIFTGPVAGGGIAWLQTQATWDRGIMTVLDVTDPNLEHSQALHDGFGRVTLVRGPDARGCSGRFPSARIEYLDTTNPSAAPVSRLRSTTFLSCTDASRTIESYVYTDALGRRRAMLTTGADDSDRRWVKGGISELDHSGAVKASYQPDYFDGALDDFAAVLAPPTLPPVRARYDAFGRTVLTLAEDGAPTRTIYHALSSEVWDAQDLGWPGQGLAPDPIFAGTPTTQRTDGHGRVNDQVLRNRQPGSPTLELHRLFTTYRADGAVTSVERAQTADDRPRAQTSVVGNRLVARNFYYDTVGRRVAATDPDTDNRGTGDTWRYLFNRAGDLVALRDPRGCGQNFYYDLAGRAVGETYVGCAEAQVHEMSVAVLPAGAVGWTQTSAPVVVDTLTTYDGYAGSWAPTPSTFKDFPADTGGLKGRVTATIDRGRRSVFAYDRRGNAIWEARQVAVIMNYGNAPLQLNVVGPPAGNDAPDGQSVVFDAEHTYVRSASMDHANRPTGIVLPADPDFPAGQAAPRVAGWMEYDRRGLPRRTSLQFVLGGGTPAVADGVLGFAGGTVDTRTVIASTEYTRDGLTSSVVYGDDLGGSRVPTQSTAEYDVRRRPLSSRTVRAPTSADMNGERSLSAVSVVHGQGLHWDSASNLVAIDDMRIGSEWAAGYRPQSKAVTHDALYRVVGVDYAYTLDGGERVDTESSTDWRTEQLRVKSADPMRQKPAPMLTSASPERVASQTWQYDWLGNMTQWADDAHAFYERSIGDITNGADLTSTERPSALYLAADLAGPPGARGGWVDLDYGVSGNVVDMTVRAQCVDPPAKVCSDPGGALASRRAFLKANCLCLREQHYQYRWDETNRLAEARRYDRAAASGNWILKVRQHYRYDAGNVRTVKHTHDLDPGGDPNHRYALYVFPGDVERRGLVRAGDRYKADAVLDTETEYMVSGARVVWQAGSLTAGVDADHRISFAVSDLLGSTNAVVDLRTGELTQYGTYYPNGARESLLGISELVPFEPNGFTGKEDDQEVGLVYFGERYLVPGIGRWLSPDPLSIHVMGGGESLNGFHYVGGNLLSARDPLGLASENVMPTHTLPDRGNVNLKAMPFTNSSTGDGKSYGTLEDQKFKVVGDPYLETEKTSPDLVRVNGSGKVYQWSVAVQKGGVTYNYRVYGEQIHRTSGEDMVLAAVFGGFLDATGISLDIQVAEAIHDGEYGRAAKTFATAVVTVGAVKLVGKVGGWVLGRLTRVEGKAAASLGAEAASGKAGANAAKEGSLACSSSCFVAGTTVKTDAGNVAIESLRVGDRVLTPRSDMAESAIDTTWRVVRLEMRSAEDADAPIYISLLRPPSWLELHSVGVGREMLLDMPEMGAHGPAMVVEVGSLSQLVASDGRVVTATIAHASQNIFMVDLGDQGVLEVTGAHRLYSADRRAWVRVDELAIGETLQTTSGRAGILHIEPENRSAWVYNIEVDAEHAYLVGPAEVWSHNACACDPARSGRPALKGDPWHPAEVAKREGAIVASNGPLAAKALGYERRIAPQRAPFNSHGQEVYSNGKNYITPDVDGHNTGGGWKMFNAKGMRIGTYDRNLNRIGK